MDPLYSRPKNWKAKNWIENFSEFHLHEGLTHLIPLVSFFTPGKNPKFVGFLLFSGGKEKDK